MAKDGKKKGLSRTERASLRRAFIKLASSKPWLIKEALERGLSSDKPLGFLELGARLLKEIGTQEQQQTQIAIVFNSNLDTNKLRENSGTVTVIQAPQTTPVLPENSLLEDLDERA